MTTIIGIKIKEGVLLSGDSQITYGNVKMPFSYPKIQSIGNCLIAGSGSVGNLQRILDRALKSIFISKILSDNYSLELIPSQLSKELANINFELPLEYKHFSPFSFLIAGQENEKNYLYSVGDDGSNLDIPSYYSEGSGSQLAMSLLNQQYDYEMKMEEAITMLYEIFSQVTKSDVYTNGLINIMLIDEKGIIKEGLLKETETLDKKTQEKKE